MPESDAAIVVAVVYAEAEHAIVKTFRLDPPATVADALRLASADPDFAAVDIEGSAVGIFGRVARRDQTLEHQDRVEIYRVLAADPKIARRARAREALKKP